ncbi:ABC transporter substrate-binding protein [Pararhodospirillum oryzae]|uniref:ABC transporter substrate-binding protein n=1 Tax=Pararhodospirillum oryzae TaxID=478448 RepID=A0A512HC44_9PROT|nr:ABC transporter substrate-binding protein [Pararhodospirillum oryzae]GEO83028.1 ABC transporter substrate-binding protein [Pararhodospirillum oryzae]
MPRPRARFSRPPRALLLALVVVLATLGAVLTPARALEFRWSAPESLPTLDPHALPGLDQQGLIGALYEGLTRRGPTLALEPGLATGWQPIGETRWRFSLRAGVRFHDGTPFRADDVVASLERARARTGPSQLADLLASVRRVRRIDDRTVDLFTTTPTPDLPERLALVPILPHDWAGRPADALRTQANGTGPFKLESFTPNGPLSLVANPLWWDRLDPSLSRATLYPAASAETRLRFLTEDRVDVALDLPPAEWGTLERKPGLVALRATGARTLFLGMDQVSPTLRFGRATGNPFQDRRVREALMRALDIDALNKSVYAGLATPAALMTSPAVAGFPDALNVRPAHDLARARALMAEAGLAGGFSVTLDCPSGRYPQDEALCAGVARALGTVGVRVSVRALAGDAYFDRVLKRETSFYLLGWQPATLEITSTLKALAACPSEERPGVAAAPGPGALNIGGACDEEAHRLILRLGATLDTPQRHSLAARALLRLRDAIVVLPLVQQPVLWGTRDRVTLAQRADGVLDLRFITLDPGRAVQ